MIHSNQVPATTFRATSVQACGSGGRDALAVPGVDLSHSAAVAIDRLEQAAKQPQAAPWALGPKRGVEELARDLQMCGGTRDAAAYWVEHSVRNIVLRSAGASLASAKSALRGWAAFADIVLHARGRHLPPAAKDLAAWSQLFRCPGTFTNYCAYLRLGCDVLGLDSSSMDGPLLRRAKSALKKRAPPPKARKFIREELLRKLLELARQEGDCVSAMLYLTAYMFLLRVPSEGLPLTTGGNPEEVLGDGAHSCSGVINDELVLRLAKRKNRVHGSTLRRACLCSTKQWLCPVHVLGTWLAAMPQGSRPFIHINAQAARQGLRKRLLHLGIADAAAYSLRDFRRGHAHDLAE
jgi:hypothetical protein